MLSEACSVNHCTCSWQFGATSFVYCSNARLLTSLPTYRESPRAEKISLLQHGALHSIIKLNLIIMTSFSKHWSPDCYCTRGIIHAVGGAIIAVPCLVSWRPVRCDARIFGMLQSCNHHLRLQKWSYSSEILYIYEEDSEDSVDNNIYIWYLIGSLTMRPLRFWVSAVSITLFEDIEVISCFFFLNWSLFYNSRCSFYCLDVRLKLFFCLFCRFRFLFLFRNPSPL